VRTHCAAATGRALEAMRIEALRVEDIEEEAGS